MIASYQFSERVNAQVILWAIGGVLVGAVRTLMMPVRWLMALVCALWAVRLAVLTVTKALALAGGLAVVFVAVFMIPPVVWLGLAITALFGWVTYPRSK